MTARGSGASPSIRRSHRDRIRVSRKNTPYGSAALRSPPGEQMQNDDPSTRVSAPPPVLVGSASGVQAPMSVVLWSSLPPPRLPPPVGVSPPPGVRPLPGCRSSGHGAIGRRADRGHVAAPTRSRSATSHRNGVMHPAQTGWPLPEWVPSVASQPLSLGGVDMRDDPPVAEMIEIAASTAPLPERAQGLLQRLNRWVPSDAAWLALCDPQSNVYATVASTGLDRSVIDYLDRPAMAQEIELTGLDRDRPPVSVADLPVPADELPTWADCLIPAGFREGLAVALFEPRGLHVGFLGLLSPSREPPSVATRDRLGLLSPLIARALSPMRSLLTIARIVKGATAGAVLLQDGTTCPLPGLGDHALLVADSPVVEIARGTFQAGQFYRSFMWPLPDGPGATGHVRMTVLAATELPAFVLGMLLLTPDVDCRGLTARELQVLGLLVEGRSNQQIAKRLAVAPRTVAAHVEHLLSKLEAPTRTLAAVRAEREGCYVPPPPAAPQARQR